LKFIPQSIQDVILIEPSPHEDTRGYFMEAFRQDLFEEAIGYSVNFIQENESKSSKGVLRGLHYQLAPYSQAKLVRVVGGRILDVAVDIRRDSTTFGQHVVVELSEKNKRQLFVPRGFAHGFLVLSEDATLIYKVDNYYSPNHDRGIFYGDEHLKINWPYPRELMQLSDKDKSHPLLEASLNFR
jgi:dTDP-4-dehydrorhamnose 3,5-epimerase